jgi:hypothetical protein
LSKENFGFGCSTFAGTEVNRNLTFQKSIDCILEGTFSLALFVAFLATQNAIASSRFFEIRLGLYSKKFRKCLINYLGFSYEQTVMSQLYLLVKHCVFIEV